MQLSLFDSYEQSKCYFNNKQFKQVNARLRYLTAFTESIFHLHFFKLNLANLSYKAKSSYTASKYFIMKVDLHLKLFVGHRLYRLCSR